MARALFYTGVRTCQMRAVPLAAGSNCAEPVTVRTRWSAISRGTERLIFEGRVPETEYMRMRAPHQDGEFPFPVKYGYACVGIVEDGRNDLAGRAVFVLHPHQCRFVVPASCAVPVPDGVPVRRAALAANVETALNALWDSRASAGDRILVVGAGLLGLLVAALAVRLPGAQVTVVDVNPERRAIAEILGAAFTLPDAAPHSNDVLFHTSATASGLSLCISRAGAEARIIEMSWYGDGDTPAPLGGAFHSRRLSLVSSQVGSLPPSHRARWTFRRRLEMALSLLADPVFDALITAEVAFDSLAETLPDILAPGAPGLATVVTYD